MALVQVVGATVWRTDRFDAARAPKHTDMDKHFSSGSVTQAQRMEMLSLITKERQAAANIINRCIDNMIVQVANICGLKVPMNYGASRFCINRHEVVQALKTVESVVHKAAILMFIFNYFGKVVYDQAIGTTHQAACEAAVMSSMNISFEGLEGLRGRSQTCIGKMYSTILNRRQQKMHIRVFQFCYRVGVEKGVVGAGKKERRGKTIYYIHKLVFDHTNIGKKICTGVEEVSECWVVLFGVFVFGL